MELQKKNNSMQEKIMKLFSVGPENAGRKMIKVHFYMAFTIIPFRNHVGIN